MNLLTNLFVIEEKLQKGALSKCTNYLYVLPVGQWSVYVVKWEHRLYNPHNIFSFHLPEMFVKFVKES